MRQLQFSTLTLLIVVAVLALALAGYSLIRDRKTATTPAAPSRSSPLAVGTLEHVTVWKRPVQRPGETGGNEGSSPPAGSRVEVYSEFVLITPPGGPTILSPHGWYTDLQFRREQW
jgi:hypothetical protein